MKYKRFKKAILATLRNYVSEDKLPVYQKLGKLRKDVFLIWGKEDADVPFKGNTRIRAVMDCELLAIEGAGH